MISTVKNGTKRKIFEEIERFYYRFAKGALLLRANFGFDSRREGQKRLSMSLFFIASRRSSHLKVHASLRSALQLISIAYFAALATNAAPWRLLHASRPAGRPTYLRYLSPRLFIKFATAQTIMRFAHMITSLREPLLVFLTRIIHVILSYNKSRR